MAEQLTELGQNHELVDPIYRNLSDALIERLKVTREQIQIYAHRNVDWSAIGPMQYVVEDVVGDLVLPTIKKEVPLYNVTAKIITRAGGLAVGVTGCSEEHGEIYPHTVGRFITKTRD